MIWAGVVLYNPTLDRFIQNMEIVIDKVDGIIIYDNGSDLSVKKYIKSIITKNVIFLGDGNNKGIAFALNEIMKTAKDKGADWVITLDQDSIISEDFISHLRKRIEFNKHIKLAIICPAIVDKRRIFPANKVVIDNKNDHEVNMCITSGSCTNIAAWEDVNGFDDYLFIDLVDNDFCKRLKARNWVILKMGGVTLDQEFGNIKPKSERVVNFYRKICSLIPNKKLAILISKLAYTKQVSPVRVYYTNRNIIYLNNKLKEIGGIGYESYSVNSYLGFLLFFDLPSIFRSKDKTRVIKAIYRGIIDGKKACVAD